MHDPTPARRLVAEALGTALLVATVVGSGVMAQTLTHDTALALLANTLATGAILGCVDGFHQDENAGEGNKGAIAIGCLVTPHRDAFEAFQFPHCLFDPGPRLVQLFWEEFRPVLRIFPMRYNWQDAAPATGGAVRL